jgi:hypothetical protein
MVRLGIRHYTLGTVAAIAMVAGCNGPPGQSEITGPIPQGAAPAGAHAQGTSPSSRLGTNGDLLYISDQGTSHVYVYSLSKDRIVRTLSGFSEPRGLCVNNAGDLWITNVGSTSLVEYAPGGTKPIAILNDPGQYPVACSVDATTGDLAVANIISAKPGPGSLSIYKNASGVPTVIPAFDHTYAAAYDPRHNLFANGVSAIIASQLGVLRHNDNTLMTLTLAGHTVANPGDLEYADGSLAVGDAPSRFGYAAIYQVVVKGSTAKVIGTTKLLQSKYVIAFSIVGHRVICLVAKNIGGGGRVAIYNYPAGGNPTKTIRMPWLLQPAGLAVGK